MENQTQLAGVLRIRTAPESDRRAAQQELKQKWP